MTTYEKGDRVRITGGAFTGHIGIITRVSAPWDATVLLEGTATPIRKDLCNIGPAYPDHLLVDEGL